MKNANVKLSPEEMELVLHTDWILTKQGIIQKVYALFGLLSKEWAAHCSFTPGLLPAEVLTVPPKIYRGEQYRQLPYVMLDYPRYFKQDNSFAIRSFFWWGHFFSIQLHLSGCWKQQVGDALFTALAAGELEGWYIAAGTDPWQHHFGEDNYLPAGSRENYRRLKESSFVKLAQKIPLQEWDHAYDFYRSRFFSLLQWYKGWIT